MTNAQKWIALFLFLFLILLGLTYITEDEYTDEAVAEATPENNLLSGEQIYADLQCANCHGENLQGTEQAPRLFNLAEYWSKTDLINYLRNPKDFGSTERIKKLKEKYSDSFMPEFNNVDAKRLGKLAEFLLSK